MWKNVSLVLFILVSINLIGCPSQDSARLKKKPSLVSEEVKKALQGTGSVFGVVKFEGEKPKLPKIMMDKECKSRHTNIVSDEKLVLGEGNTVANVFIFVKSGLPQGVYPIPEAPVVLNQQGCMYTPHVFGMVAGQQLKVLNSDGILHNVHVLSKANEEQNVGMPGDLKETTLIFTQAEAMFTVKCDVHPWMTCYAGVMAHPYFAVSGADGKFAIEKLQPGTYEIEIWHEMGEQIELQPGKSITVTLAEGEKKELKFAVSLKK